jgi:hypothetical protein
MALGDKYRERDRLREVRRARPHWVYLAQLGRVLKVGMSRNPHGRVGALENEARSLGLGEFGPATMIAAIEMPDWSAARQLEAAFIRALARYTVSGVEWFYYHPAIKRHFHMVRREAKANGYRVIDP